MVEEETNEPVIDPTTFSKRPPATPYDEFPEHLKDPRNYIKIQKALLEELATTHSHSDVLEWGECYPCMLKMRNFSHAMKAFGFETPGHYYAWKKTHEQMKRYTPLVDWSKQ